MTTREDGMSDLVQGISEDKDLGLQEEDVVVVGGEGDVTALDPSIAVDARRRLENLLDERRLRDELKDFLDD